MNKKLYLSEYNKKVAGVCGGIAEYFGFEASIVRILWVLLTFLFRGFPIVVYILLWAVIPKQFN